jgi:hypothetical protein
MLQLGCALCTTSLWPDKTSLNKTSYGYFIPGIFNETSLGQNGLWDKAVLGQNILGNKTSPFSGTHCLSLKIKFDTIFLGQNIPDSQKTRILISHTFSIVHAPSSPFLCVAWLPCCCLDSPDPVAHGPALVA